MRLTLGPPREPPQQGREGGDGGGSGRRARLRHDVACYPPSSSPGPQQGCRGGHHPSLGIDGDPGCARPRPAIRSASHRGSLQVPMRALRSPATPVRARRACPCAAQSQKREINYGSCSASAVAVLPVSTVATCEVPFTLMLGMNSGMHFFKLRASMMNKWHRFVLGMSTAAMHVRTVLCIRVAFDDMHCDLHACSFIERTRPRPRTRTLSF